MKNNKGVTLIELLIVIVVIGIISAFAVPAVSSFLDNAKKQAVYQDAIAVRNAAAYYCAAPGNTCTATQELEYSHLSTYLDSFDAALYDTEVGDTLATLSSGSWQINLEGEATAAPFAYEWVTTTDPANGSTAQVLLDND